MDNNRQTQLDWMVFDWNVRGLNDKNKRLAVYNKIEECHAAVICLQETKCQSFDHSFVRSLFLTQNCFSRLVRNPLCLWVFIHIGKVNQTEISDAVLVHCLLRSCF